MAETGLPEAAKRAALRRHLGELSQLSPEQLVRDRYRKFRSMGVRFAQVLYGMMPSSALSRSATLAQLASPAIARTASDASATLRASACCWSLTSAPGSHRYAW